MNARELINEIRAKQEKYGNLTRGENFTHEQVAGIIAYYETGGELAALADQDVVIEELKQRIAKLHGSEGGKTKRINALQAQVAELTNVQDNNKKLARATSYATDLLEHLSGSTYVDSIGDAIIDNPLYVRAAAEFGIGEVDDGQGK